MERKIFWAVFLILGLVADFTLPIMVVDHDDTHRLSELVDRLPFYVV